MLKRASTFVAAALLIAWLPLRHLRKLNLPKNSANSPITSRDHYTKREVQIPMRDGVKLFASIYEPKDKDKKYPIMFDRTPYSVAPYGPKEFKTSLGPRRTVSARRLHLRLSGRARPVHERRRL